MRLPALIVAALLGIGPAGGALAEAIVTPAGWTARSAPSGTVFFDCRDASCGRGSVVSYHAMADGPLSPEATFRSQAAVVTERMVTLSRGQLVDARQIEVFSDTVGPVRAHTILRSLHPKDGAVSYMAASEASDGQRRFSIVSTSASEATVRANMKAFLMVPLMARRLNDVPPAAR